MKAAIVQGDRERVILTASDEVELKAGLARLDARAAELNVGRIGHVLLETNALDSIDLDTLIHRVAEVPSPQVQPGPGPEFLRGMGPRC